MNYKVSFFKKATEEDKKDEHLGTVYLDDLGTSNTFTLVAKAFRQAPPICLMADLTYTERVQNG